MALRFSGRISDHLVGALLGVVMQEGWDRAKDWLRAQGVLAERVTAVPNHLPPNHPYHYYNYEGGFYCWHFVDPHTNIHVRLRCVWYPTSSGPMLRWEV